jgi:hypothetical protein
MSEQDIIVTIFVWIAFLLLITVTGGVGYLTYLSRRDRRRRGED